MRRLTAVVHAFDGLVTVTVSMLLIARATTALAEETLSQTESTAIGKSMTVAADGSGDFKTVQEAINAAPVDKNASFKVHIKPGTYREKLTIPKDKGPILLLGEDPATTVLTFDDHAKTIGADGKQLGTAHSASVTVRADDFTARNITFENSAGRVGQAVAVAVSSDRAIFRKCRFLGWQDTLWLRGNRQYFEDCYIAGHEDFVFGASAAWFERCELYCRLGGAITAASTPKEQPFGLVFSKSKITAAPIQERRAHNRPTSVLGRPWRPYASVIFLNTEMSDVVAPAGWENWDNPTNEKTARYAEYHSTGPGANSQTRVAWSRQLTQAEANAITVEKVLNGWNPVSKSACRSIHRSGLPAFACKPRYHQRDCLLLPPETIWRALNAP
jgi:pectinesterase